MRRTSPEQHYEQLQEARPPLVIDARSDADYSMGTRRIEDDLRVSQAHREDDLERLPRGRDYVVYCTCPDEATSARAADILEERNYGRASALKGGFDAWEQQ